MDDDGQPPRLGPYLDQWLRRREHQLRPSTRVGYARAIANYLRPQLGERRLDELDRQLLEEHYAWLQTSGGVRRGRLSVRTVGYAHMVLRRALEDAVIDGLLPTNPARGARPPRYDPDAVELDDEPQVWTVEQAATFLDFVDDDPWRALWHLAVGTGARRGELLGLRWRDVDLEAATVEIRRSLSRTDGIVRLLATKTANRRVLALGQSVVEAVQRHGREQEQRRAAAERWDNQWGLVFTDDEGAPVQPGRVTSEFRRLVRLAPVPVVRLHDLRHFHATALLEAGVPAKVVSRRLGHATVAITLDVYSHVLPSMDLEAAQRFEAALWGASLRSSDDRR